MWSGTLLLVVVAALVLFPLPYVVQRPGPTIDTLGEHDDKPVIAVSDHETYPTSGALRLTTVSVRGGPGYSAHLFDVVAGWWRTDSAVKPTEMVFPPDVTSEQIDEQNAALMASSQESATVAALEELGIAVPTVLRVMQAVPGTGAEGLLMDGDVIVSANGVTLTSFLQLHEVLAKLKPGDTVTLGVKRHGEETSVKVVTTDGGNGEARLGVLMNPSFTFPVEIKFDIQNVGGPSAGLMFALGIIDKMTPGSLTGGQVVAGTGTMDLAGVVGPIGGIQQKLYGARDAGATWFLAPRENCNEVVGQIPNGLHVTAVTTLHEARLAVEAIAAGKGETLPKC